MKCSFCNTENPDGAKFCKHCGKPITQEAIVCPTCQTRCLPNTRFCAKCGTKLSAAHPVTENAPKAAPVTEGDTQKAPMTETEAQETAQVVPMPEGEEQETAQAVEQSSPQRRGIDEPKQKKLGLVSGILMMGAVFLSLIFVFFIGVEYKVGTGYNNYDTYTVWHYFGRAYSMLESDLMGHGYSAYTIAAGYIPTILSTIIAVAALGTTVAFSLVAAVKFGLHCKRFDVNYYKYSVAAVFSFLLGAVLFDCIHSTSMHNESVSLSSTTIAGMVFTCFLIIASLVVRTISIGNRFKKKQAVLDCVCTLIGILFLAMTSGFANSAQADYVPAASGYYSSSSIGFFQLNNLLSLLYTAETSVPGDYVATFTCSLIAIISQFAVQILAFILLVSRIGNYTEKREFSLVTSIILTGAAAMYLTFSIISLEFANYVILANYTSLSKLWIATAPIMTFVSSLLHLTVSITHRVVAKKESPEDEEKEAEEEKEEAAQA